MRASVNLLDLEKILSLSEASVQPRRSLSKVGGDFFHFIHFPLQSRYSRPYPWREFAGPISAHPVVRLPSPDSKNGQPWENSGDAIAGRVRLPYFN